MTVYVLFVSLVLGYSSWITTNIRSENPPISTINSSAIGDSLTDGPDIGDKNSKTVRCDDPKGYNVEEGNVAGTNDVNIVREGTVLHTIKLPTGVERNGFAFDGAKKTKEGFEIAIEYGSRIFYGKSFIFICRQHRFYLSKIRVDSFDRQNPAKWSSKVIRVRPNVPLEKFSVDDFMLEGVVRNRK